MSTASPPLAKRIAPTTPPLANGDRLTREEFERRYDAMPGLKKAELIKESSTWGLPSLPTITERLIFA